MSQIFICNFQLESYSLEGLCNPLQFFLTYNMYLNDHSQWYRMTLSMCSFEAKISGLLIYTCK